MGSATEKERIRAIVALALAESYDSCEELVPTLEALCADCAADLVEETSRNLIRSTEPERQAIGFLLQSAVQEEDPEPGPIEWRELALDLTETQISAIDLMYSIRPLMDRETDSTKKQEMSRLYRVAQRLQGELGTTARAMRDSDWTSAKKTLNATKIFSTSPSKADEFGKAIDHPYKGIVRRLQEETKKLRNRILPYPSKIAVSSERVKIILRVQSAYIPLLRINHRHEKNPLIDELTSYPLEKLGVAIDYLLSSGKTIEEANYEIGLAASSLQRGLPKAQGRVREELARIAAELDLIFSELPAKPWPVEGFGSPDVESRFADDS